MNMSLYSLALLPALFLSTVVTAQDVLQPPAFKAGLEAGDFDLVIDVRTFDEWASGHIANTGFVENLASSDDNVDKVLECSNCTIAIYCRSGNRAGQAITKLQDEYGFSGTIYNALGVSQWTSAGFELTTDSEVLFPCQKDECEGCETDTCMEPEMDSASSESPSEAPTADGARSILNSLGATLVTLGAATWLLL